MKNKGFTIIEIMFAFALLTVIVIFLFEIIISIKELYISSGIQTELLNKQAILTKKINYDFKNKQMKAGSKCGANCILFIYDDETSKELKIDKENKTITYGDYTTELIDGSYFGDIYVSSETIITSPLVKNNAILKIDIPIKHKLVKKNYGINIVYQYDTNEVAISDLIFDDNVSRYGKTYIVGNAVTVAFYDELYEDLGIVSFDEDGKKIDNPNVQIINPFTSMNLPYTLGEYTITYNILNSSNEVLQTLTRTVQIIKEKISYQLTSSSQVFKAGARGKYLLEVWGAQGGSYDNNSVGGTGGYSKGEIYLNKNDELYVFVGGKGNALSSQVVTGGYNGGGNGSYYGGSGGGATDIRTTNGDWNNQASLESRIIVAGGGGGANGRQSSELMGSGGNGGGIVGKDGRYEDNSFNGKGGTALAGGAKCSATTNGTPTAGTLGIGGNAGYYNASYGAGGGGGGYYGGGGGCERYGAGGGGSGYFGTLINGETISTNSLIPTNDSDDPKNGYAKITFISSIANNGLETDDDNISDYVSNGLILHYDGKNPPQNNVWMDLSNSNNDGTLYGFDNTSGWENNYIYFDGVDDKIISQNNLGLSGNAAFTMCSVASWEDSNWISNYPSYMGVTETSTNNGLSMTMYNGRPALDFWNYRYQATNPLNVKTIYQICLTKEPGSISTTSKIYVNAVEVTGSGNNSSNPNIIDSPAVIGQLDNTRWANAKIRNAMFYNRALNQDEIRNNYYVDKRRFNF